MTRKREPFAQIPHELFHAPPECLGIVLRIWGLFSETEQRRGLAPGTLEELYLDGRALSSITGKYRVDHYRSAIEQALATFDAWATRELAQLYGGASYSIEWSYEAHSMSIAWPKYLEFHDQSAQSRVEKSRVEESTEEPPPQAGPPQGDDDPGDSGSDRDSSPALPCDRCVTPMLCCVAKVCRQAPPAAPAALRVESLGFTCRSQVCTRVQACSGAGVCLDRRAAEGRAEGQECLAGCEYERPHSGPCEHRVRQDRDATAPWVWTPIDPIPPAAVASELFHDADEPLPHESCPQGGCQCACATCAEAYLWRRGDENSVGTIDWDPDAKLPMDEPEPIIRTRSAKSLDSQLDPDRPREPYPRHCPCGETRLLAGYFEDAKMAWPDLGCGCTRAEVMTFARLPEIQRWSARRPSSAGEAPLNAPGTTFAPCDDCPTETSCADAFVCGIAMLRKAREAGADEATRPNWACDDCTSIEECREVWQAAGSPEHGRLKCELWRDDPPPKPTRAKRSPAEWVTPKPTTKPGNCSDRKPKRSRAKPFPEPFPEDDAYLLGAWAVAQDPPLSQGQVSHALGVVGDWARSNDHHRRNWVAVVQGAIRRGWGLDGCATKPGPSDDDPFARAEAEQREAIDLKPAEEGQYEF